MPIKLKIENTSAFDLSSVELFDCLKKITVGRKNYEYGAQLSVEYPADITYNELLWNIATGTELNISAIAIRRSEDTFKESLLLKLSDLFGTKVSVPLDIETDPEQDIRVDKKILFITEKIVIDKRASLVLKGLKANSTVIVDLLREEDMVKKRDWFAPNAKTPDRGSKIIIMVEEQMMIGVMNDNGNVKIEEGVNVLWSAVEMWSVCEEEPVLPQDTQ